MTVWDAIVKYQSKRWADRVNSRLVDPRSWRAYPSDCLRYARNRRRFKRLYKLIVGFWDENWWSY